MGKVFQSTVSEHVIKRETFNRTKELLVRAREIGRDIAERVDKLLGKEHAMPEQVTPPPTTMFPRPLSETQRQEIFRALVEVQDQQIPVAQSRLAVAEHFSISENQVRRIEQEGLDNNWPPLDEEFESR